MKYLVRVFLFNVFSLWITVAVLPTLFIGGNWHTILLAGLTLSLLMLIVSPVLKILFIPINFLTFGLLSWFINVVIIYLLTVFVPQVEIKPWTFPGIIWQGFTVPSVRLSYFSSLVVTSLVVTFISNILHKTSED